MAEKKSGSGEKLLYCSFCGKSQHEVKKLIAGPSVFICDECIELCNDIIRDEIAAEPEGGARSDLPAPKEIRAILDQYRSHGIRHLVALRGDLPSGMAQPGTFRYANELVEFIRQETGDWFHIEVAAYPEYHPQAKSPEDDLRAFKRKVDAGADSAITQYFYNLDAYVKFVDACQAAGVKVPIVPGIMPIASFANLARFSDNCGAEIPRWMRKKLESYADDRDSIRAFGLDVVTDLCERLLASGAPGLHFYTLNQVSLTSELWRRLGLN